MMIKIDADKRLVALENPSVFAVGEEMDVTISGADSLDINTANLCLYSVDGTLLSVSAEFIKVDGEIVCTVSTKFAPVYHLFFECRPDERLPVICVLQDANRTWGSSSVEMCNRVPDGTSPILPIPQDLYVRNPMTGLYHKLTADVNEYGEMTTSVSQTGVPSI